MAGDTSIAFQRRMLADMIVGNAGDGKKPEDYLVRKVFRDPLTREPLSRLEAFDRHAELLAICTEFGV